MERLEKYIVELTNVYRHKNGLDALTWSDTLSALAGNHSKNMSLDIVQHGHKNFKQRVKQFDIAPNAPCENIVIIRSPEPDDRTSALAVNEWINSPKHRRNLLSKNVYCGVGMRTSSKNKDVYYITQLFG